MRNEFDRAIRDQMTSGEILNSRDFVRVAFKILDEHRPNIARYLEPIHRIEVDNPGADSPANVCHSITEMRIDGLNRAHAIVRAYRSLLDFLLLDDIVADIYPMDKKDLVGWRIWQELDAKYAYANSKLKEYTYIENKNAN